MSNYNEAPYLSRTDWVTIPEAARAVQRRPNQVRGWIIDGKVVSCKQGRRRLVSLESCQDFVQRAPNHRPSRHRRNVGPAPVVIPAPAPQHSCDLVQIDVGGRELLGARLDGQELIPLRTLEELLGMGRGSLRGQIMQSGEYQPGVHLIVLRGSSLGAMRSEGSEDSSLPSWLRKTSQLSCLTPAGVALALMKSRSPVCAEIRNALSRSGFMREIGAAVIQQDGDRFAAALTADQLRSQIRAELRAELAAHKQQTEQMVRDVVAVAVREAIAQIVPALSQPASRGNDHRCTLTASRAATLVSRQLFRTVTESEVHQIAREIEKQESGGVWGEGLPGYSEQRVPVGRAWPVWFYSPAMVAAVFHALSGGQTYLWRGQ
jgi:hypothetical protein